MDCTGYRDFVVSGAALTGDARLSAGAPVEGCGVSGWMAVRGDPRSRSDGYQVATGAPFLEARTGAADQGELLEEVRAALAPEFRVAAAVFEPGGLADAAIRHEAATRV